MRECVQEARSSKECVVRLDRESKDNHRVLEKEDMYQEDLEQMDWFCEANKVTASGC